MPSKEQEREIRAAALKRWRTERGDYAAILDAESRRLTGEPFELRRLAVPRQSAGASRANRPPTVSVPTPEWKEQRASIMRRALKAVSAMKKLPAMAPAKFHTFLEAVEVRGQPELTYKRFVARLIEHYQRQKDHDVFGHFGPATNPLAPAAKQTKRKPGRRRSRRPNSSPAGPIRRVLRGGLPSLGRRR